MIKRYACDLLTFISTFSLLMIYLSKMNPSRGQFSTKASLVAMIIILNLASLINPIVAVDVNCEDDSDCTYNQYCYKTSFKCVDYTKCSRYNRQEGEKQAQSPSQCGPCIPGFTAEMLTTGFPAEFCNRNISNNNGGSNSFPPEKKFLPWIYTSSGVFLVIIIFGLVAFFSRKQVSLHSNKKWFQHVRKWSFSPSAPIPDNGAIYSQTTYYDGPPIYSVINNNQSVKDRNCLVNAVPCHPPNWIQSDANYGHDDPDTSATIPVLTNMPEDEETNPSTWTPEEVTIQLPARAFHQFATEQRDNVLNTVLVRGDCASNSEPADETTTGPTPGATGNSRSTNDSYRGPNVQINQMITLNMVNSDN